MGFFDKIKAGLTKTRDALSDSLSGLFSGGTEIDDDFYDELEESLILADLGVETAAKATAALRKTIRERHITKTEEARSALKEILTERGLCGAGPEHDAQRGAGHRRQRCGQDHHHWQDRQTAVR